MILHACATSACDAACCCREERCATALTGKGAAVCSGIILTKLVGVSMLAFSRTQIFEVYYFRMYMALVAVGTFHSLLLLPVLLSLIGTQNEEPYVPSDIGDEATEAPPPQVCLTSSVTRITKPWYSIKQRGQRPTMTAVHHIRTIYSTLCMYCWLSTCRQLLRLFVTSSRVDNCADVCTSSPCAHF